MRKFVMIGDALAMRFYVRTLCFAWVSAVLGVSVTGGLADRALSADAAPFVPLEMMHVTGHGVLELVDGGELCLAGIAVPTKAQQAGNERAWLLGWHDIIDRGGFGYEPKPYTDADRYGCPKVFAQAADGTHLQHALLAAGWATVDPLSMPDALPVIDAMLAVEARARDAGLGIWKEPDARPKPTDDLSAWIGTRQLVEGRVYRVGGNKRYVYLNFGADWRTDFTARLDRKMIKRADIDEAIFDGKKLRLRGVLTESRGPLMTISHQKQIEILP